MAPAMTSQLLITLIWISLTTQMTSSCIIMIMNRLAIDVDVTSYSYVTSPTRIGSRLAKTNSLQAGSSECPQSMYYRNQQAGSDIVKQRSDVDNDGYEVPRGYIN